MISTAIGGSPAESWLSEANSKKYLEDWLEKKARIDSILMKRKEEGIKSTNNLFADLNRNDPGLSRWSKADVDVLEWPSISLPGYGGTKG